MTYIMQERDHRNNKEIKYAIIDYMEDDTIKSTWYTELEKAEKELKDSTAEGIVKSWLIKLEV